MQPAVTPDGNGGNFSDGSGRSVILNGTLGHGGVGGVWGLLGGLAGGVRVGLPQNGNKTPCNIQQKRTYHNDIVNHTAQEYIKAGYSVAFNLSLRKVGTGGTSLRAVAGFIATVPGSGIYDIHEIKTGDAQLTRNQDSVDDTGHLQVVGNAGLPIGLENGDVVPFVFDRAKRFEGCTP